MSRSQLTQRLFRSAARGWKARASVSYYTTPLLQQPLLSSPSENQSMRPPVDMYSASRHA